MRLNLERNLYLTLQLLKIGIPCIVALNMLDIAEKQNIRIEIDALSARLGCPVIPLVSTRGRGTEALKLAIDRYKKLTRMWNWCITHSRYSTKQIHWQK